MEELNFNRHRPPILPVVLMDDHQTRLNITPPTVELQDELRATYHELRDALQGSNAEAADAMYSLAARLISCNRNMITITPEELHRKYRMDLEDLVVFFDAYSQYIREMEAAKN